MRARSEESADFEFRLREGQATSYDAQYEAVHGPWFPRIEVRVIRGALDLRPDDVLLDFGCGTGRLLPQLAPLCREVIAVDRSKSSLAILERRLQGLGIENVRCVQADATIPISMDRAATKAISVQLLQHIPGREGRLAVLRNLRAALAPGGRCLLINETYGLIRRLRNRSREESGEGTLFFHTFAPNELRDDLKLAGFRPTTERGLGIAYWTGYRIAPFALAKLDEFASTMPGSRWIAKFQVVAAKVS